MRRLLTTALVATVAAGATLAPAVAANANAGATYYVDCSRSAAGNGSMGAPWNAMQQVTDHAAFSPGDKILLKRGTTCRGRVLLTNSGTPGAPILLGSWGSGTRPLIAGGGTTNGTGAIELRNVHDWIVQDLRVTNSDGRRDTPIYRSGVLIRNGGAGILSNITVQRLDVSGVTSNPAYTARASSPRDFGGITTLTYGQNGGDGFNNLRIIDNTISKVGRSGISTSNEEYPQGWDRNVLVARNKVSFVRGDSIIMNGAKNSTIGGNTSAYGARFWPCSTCGGISPRTANAAIWTANSDRVTIEHNEAYGERAIGGDGEGLDIDANALNTVIQYNYIHDNDGGAVLFCGSTGAIARFNIFENNKKSAIAFIGSMPANNTKIYNNTIYQSKSSKAGIVRYFNGPYGSGTRFYNNVVFSYANGQYKWPYKSWKTSLKPVKLWSHSNTFVGTHAAGEPQGAAKSWRDPGLKKPGSGGVGLKTLGGYKPRKASTFPKGVAIAKNVTRDFFGKKINPAKPPRGAAG